MEVFHKFSPGNVFRTSSEKPTACNCICNVFLFDNWNCCHVPLCGKDQLSVLFPSPTYSLETHLVNNSPSAPVTSSPIAYRWNVLSQDRSKLPNWIVSHDVGSEFMIQKILFCQ